MVEFLVKYDKRRNLLEWNDKSSLFALKCVILQGTFTNCSWVND